ncbi:MAG: ABC transporter permease subunit, partial [Rubrivivax sp.]
MAPVVPALTPAPGAWARFFDGDIWYSFRTSPVAIVAAVLAFICMFCALFAPWVSPHNPFDLASLELSDARLPPAWEADGRAKYLLGTDDQGRVILSALMYGARISLFVGFAAVLLSVVVGVSLGLLSGFVGGKIDAFIMRVCDVMLSFPSILVALLIDGVGRALFPNAHEALAFSVLIIAISLTGWVPYARTVRGSTLVERNKEYVQAARVIGVSPGRIMLKHVLLVALHQRGAAHGAGIGHPAGERDRDDQHAEGQRIDNLPYEQLRAIRGLKIGAIFQDPLT